MEKQACPSAAEADTGWHIAGEASEWIALPWGSWRARFWPGGIGSFVEKLAADRLGAQSVFWHALAYATGVIVYSLVVVKFGNLRRSTAPGASLALLGGALSSFGIVGTYVLLTRTEATRIIPLIALYPALTSVLAILFLRESKDPGKLLGITLSPRVDLPAYALTRSQGRSLRK
ncbi:MAG: DMT family transporter [Anaerolineales bacterium]